MNENQTPELPKLKDIIAELYAQSQADKITSIALVVVDDKGGIRTTYFHDGIPVSALALVEASRRLTQVLVEKTL